MYKVHDLIDGYDCGCWRCYKHRSLNVEVGKTYRPVRSPQPKTYTYRRVSAMYVQGENPWDEQKFGLAVAYDFDLNGTDVLLCIGVIDDKKQRFYNAPTSLSAWHSETLVRCVSSDGIVYVFGGDRANRFLKVRDASAQPLWVR